jgi:DNA-binding PadR family transcriptional regulator
MTEPKIVPTKQDEKVMMGVREGKSITEMVDDGVASTGGVYNILTRLEEANLVVQPVKGKHRARKLTDSGEQYLLAQGLISPQVFLK